MTDDLVGRLLNFKSLHRDAATLFEAVDTIRDQSARIEALEGDRTEWLGIMRHLAEGRGRDLARAIIAKEDANVRP